MGLELLRSLLGWCVIVNYAILIVWFALFTLLHEPLLRLHGRWYTLDPVRFDALNYQLIGLYKILVIVFNLVPWLALHILG